MMTSRQHDDRAMSDGTSLPETDPHDERMHKQRMHELAVLSMDPQSGLDRDSDVDIWSQDADARQSMVRIGQVWQRRDGSQARVEGFSKIDRGWVKLREVGGGRERGSYPLESFSNGSFELVSDAA
jgi:hypothetical protein